MGLFSWQCKKCDHSIKSPYNVPEGWEYMNEVVMLSEGNEPIIGEYDGYGRIDGRDAGMVDDDPELWHKKCWENAGKPEYTGESDYAEDQGYFYGDPTDEEIMEAIRASE